MDFSCAWIPTVDTQAKERRTQVESAEANRVGQRKYQTEAAARAGGATWWREKSWPECLYKKLTVGRYFYRARSGGARSFLQLETDDLVIAKPEAAHYHRRSLR